MAAHTFGGGARKQQLRRPFQVAEDDEGYRVRFVDIDDARGPARRRAARHFWGPFRTKSSGATHGTLQIYAPGDPPPDVSTRIQYSSTALFCKLAPASSRGSTTTPTWVR